MSAAHNAVAGLVVGEEGLTLDDWVLGLGASPGEVIFKVARMEPAVFNGKNLKGHMFETTDPPSEEALRSEFGGGKYRIQVVDANTRKVRTSRTIPISGDPRLPGGNNGSASGMTDAVSEEPSLVRQAMNMQETAAERERLRAERAEARARDASQLDTDMLDRLTRPLEAQLTTFREELATERQRRADMEREHKQEIDRARQELQNRRGEDTGALTNMIAAEQTRLGNLRAQHESELRSLRESQASEIRQVREAAEMKVSRVEDQRKSDIERSERERDRELRQAEKASNVQLEAQKLSYEGRMDSLKQRLGDLERQISRLELEAVELRSKKEKTLLESVKEVAEFRSTMDDAGFGGGGGDTEKGTFDKIMEVAGPILQSVGNRIENAQPQPPPPPRPMRRRPQPGQVQQRQPGAQPVAQPGSQGQPAQPRLKLKRDEVAMAVKFMEGAIASKTPPAVFAESARSMVSREIVVAIRTFGVDKFLTEVAHVPSNSLLLTTEGRQFLRKTVAILLGPTAADLPPLPPETAITPLEDMPGADELAAALANVAPPPPPPGAGAGVEEEEVF